MKKSEGIPLLDKLLKEPSFTAKEAKQLGVSSALLGHYLKQGYIRRLSRGVYQSCSYEHPITRFQWQDLIETLGTVPKGRVCLISALALYGITEEIPRQHWIAVSHGTTVKRGRLIRIVRFRDMNLGATTIDLDGFSLPIFDVERTIVDSFRLLSREVAIKALKMASSYRGKGKKKLDLIKLQKYAKKLRFDITPYLLTVTT
ncbi:MAG: hypothetical protein HKM07_05760 [Chlamydiae bacterium]|nr:hypothetical protein [Chlamydiota bacterium]